MTNRYTARQFKTDCAVGYMGKKLSDSDINLLLTVDTRSGQQYGMTIYHATYRYLQETTTIWKNYNNVYYYDSGVRRIEG